MHACLMTADARQCVYLSLPHKGTLSFPTKEVTRWNNNCYCVCPGAAQTLLTTVSSPAGSEAALRTGRTTELQGLLDHEGAHATCCRSWKAGGEDKSENRSSAEGSMGSCIPTLLSQRYSETKASRAASTHTQTISPPTLAPPRSLEQIQPVPAFPSTFLVPSRGMCSDKSDTQNHLQKDAFGMVIILYSNTALQIQDYGRERSWRVIQRPSTTQEGNRIR